MPNYKTHAFLGLLVALVICFTMFYFKVEIMYFYLLAFLIAITYSLLPDIDHRNSIIRLIFTFIGLGIILYFAFIKEFLYVIIIDLIMLGLFFVTLITGHRGWFHSLSAGFFLSLPLMFFSDSISIPFIPATGFVAYVSHIILDKFIKRDVYD